MTAEQLRNSILQEAISGRLVPQDPNDEPASVLLQHIREEKARLVKEGKLKKKDLVETPITDDEKPFEIPSSWAWLRISDLCYITNGFTPLRTEPRFWTNGSISWFTVEDIRKQGEIINYTTQKITPAATSQERIVRAGSTLLCCTASVGQCAITNIPLTTNQQFNALTVKEWFMPIVDDKYLYWFAKTLAPTLHSLAGQTTFEFVSVKKVGSILIPLPPLAEQKRIVAKLEELLPIVEQYGKAQKELDELNAALPTRLRQSILQEAISGRLVPQDPNDESASVLLARIREEKARLVKEGKLKKKDLVEAPITDDEKSFEIPSSWEWVRIRDICSIVNGFTPRRTEPKFWTNGTINWFTVEDINKQGEVIRYTEQKITKAATSEDRIVRPGSVLLCCTASVGRCAITTVPVTTNQQFNALTVKEEFRKAVSDTYILTIAKTLAPTLHQLAGQTTFEFVSVAKVGNIVFPLPPLAEQKRIVAKIEELFEQIDKISQ